MNTDLVAKTTAALTLHAGKYAKHVPAGTNVWVREEAIESGRAAIYVRVVVGHERIGDVVYRSAIVPA
jgi:hypothetical protein